METPQIERGDPSAGPGSQALGFGDAKRLNEGVKVAKDAEAAQAQTEEMLMPEGVDLTGAQSVKDEPFRPQDEDREFLLGPTDEPWRHVAQDTGWAKPHPRDAEKYIPRLLEAANDPTAPEELHALIRLLSTGVDI